MDNNNRRKNELLGMSHGSAVHRLRKAIMFRMLKRLGEDACFHCGKKIENIDDLSIEHIKPWQSAKDPLVAFFDLDNIAFSHLKCNCAAASKSYAGHGTYNSYNRGCRCKECTKANTDKCRRYDLRLGYRNHNKKRSGVPQ